MDLRVWTGDINIRFLLFNFRKLIAPPISKMFLMIHESLVSARTHFQNALECQDSGASDKEN